MKNLDGKKERGADTIRLLSCQKRNQMLLRRGTLTAAQQQRLIDRASGRTLSEALRR